MPAPLPIDDAFRVNHYLKRAVERGDCLCIGLGNYYPTWHKMPGRKSERIAQLICRVVHGDRPNVQSVVMHACDNRACIKPEHLSWGTQSQNLVDAFLRGRHTLPRQDQAELVRRGLHHWAKLRPEQVIAIRSRLATREQLASIAADFGVGIQAISKIKLGYRWGHL